MRLLAQRFKRGRGNAVVEHRNESTCSKTKAQNDESDPFSKPSVAARMRRALLKENPSSKTDGRSSLFRKRNRIRKTRTSASDGQSSPTTSRTVTEESSSQYCRSRSEESPSRKLIVEPLSFRDTVQIDEAYYGSRNTVVHPIGYEDQENKSIEDEPCGNSLPLTPQRSSTVGLEERVNKDVEQQFVFPKSEIITKLFPMGYPSSRATENSLSRETPNFVPKDRQKDTSKHLGRPVENCYDETYGSTFPTTESISSLIPVGFPDEVEKKHSNCNSEFVETDSESQTSVDHDCDKFIGLVITFDPTWDLLAPGPEETYQAANMVKSRLRKFHEIENYADSLLGKLSGEESSEESADLIADVNLSFGTESSPFLPKSMLKDFMAEKKSSNKFELGYHFDHKRFPPVDLSEVEICFYPDEASVGCPEDLVDDKNSKTLRLAENLTIREKILYFEELRDDVHADKADCVRSIGGKKYLNESVACPDCTYNRQRPINPFAKRTKSNSLPFLSSPQQSVTPHNLYLFTDKDENEHGGYESSSTTSTQNMSTTSTQNLFMPHYGSSSQTTPFSSKRTVLTE